jgi:recombination DNA repair RAD52 pathway protein
MLLSEADGESSTGLRDKANADQSQTITAIPPVTYSVSRVIQAESGVRIKDDTIRFALGRKNSAVPIC